MGKERQMQMLPYSVNSCHGTRASMLMSRDLLPIPLCPKDRLGIILYHIVSFILQLSLHHKTKIQWLWHPQRSRWAAQGARRQLWPSSPDGQESIQEQNPSTADDREGCWAYWWARPAPFETLSHAWLHVGPHRGMGLQQGSHPPNQ